MKRNANLQGFVLLIFFGYVFFSLSSCSGRGSGGIPAAPPKPKTVVSVGVSAVAGDNMVSLGWSSVANAASYDIYSSTSPTQTGSRIASVTSPTTTYVDNSVTNGTTYYYIVEAIDGGGGLIGTSPQVSATPSLVSGSVTVSGTVLYQDKEYGVNGFTPNQPYKAVRYAAVELVSSSTSTVLSSAVTDSNGFYSMSTAPTLTVYVRISAEATPPGSSVPIEVKDLSTSSIYAARGNDFLLSGSATVNISIPSTLIGGAFNILDVFTNGFQFVYSLANAYPPALSAYWQTGNADGTFYCNSYDPSQCIRGEGIYVLNYGGDTDEYDDDVLYHEFGHFAAAHFSQDDSPGGPHTLTNNDLDMRLAWSEGWGDSMPGNIKLWLYATSPELISATGVYPAYLTSYIDTYGTSAQIAIDMDNPGVAPYVYACGEVAIAKILLDANQSFGMDRVWSVIADFKASPPTSPVNLELFWDRWNSKGYSSLQSIFTARLIDYFDLYTDNTPSTAPLISLNTPTTRNLYPAGDADYVSFNVSGNQHYTIKTFNLVNGADTSIELYNSPTQTSPIAFNDNSIGFNSWGSYAPSYFYPYLCDSYWPYVCHDNGDDILGSTLGFTAPSPGTYYAKITSSLNRPLSAGRYGSYTLTITSP